VYSIKVFLIFCIEHWTILCPAFNPEQGCTRFIFINKSPVRGVNFMRNVDPQYWCEKVIKLTNLNY